MEHAKFNWTEENIKSVTSMGGTKSTTVELSASMFSPDSAMSK
eukprot:gene21623-33806_t